MSHAAHIQTVLEGLKTEAKTPGDPGSETPT